MIIYMLFTLDIKYILTYDHKIMFEVIMYAYVCICFLIK